MKKQKSTFTRIRGLAVSATVPFLLASVVLIVACQGSGADSDAGGIASLNSSTKTQVGTPGLMPPSLETLTSTLNLTSDQAARLGAALDEWSSGIDARRALREERRNRDGQRQRGSETGVSDRRSPLRTFLASSAEILSSGQFITMTELLTEQREALVRERGSRSRGERLRGRKGPRGGSDHRQGFGEDMAEELNLTSEQVTALDAAFATLHETIQSLRPERGSGDVPDHDATQAAHDQLREAIEQILNADQLARWEELRGERRDARIAKMDEGAQERLENRLEFLTAVLALDPGQQTAVAAVMADAQAQRKELRESARESDKLHDGSQREEGGQIAEAANNAIRDILSGDQMAVFDAVQELFPRRGEGSGGHGRRHGLGRGFGFLGGEGYSPQNQG